MVFFLLSISIENGFDRHHRPLPDPSVHLLFPHCPFGCLPCQPLPIHVHKPPQLVEKVPDNLNGASVKALAYSYLGFLEFSFIDFSVLIFAPTPIL